MLAHCLVKEIPFRTALPAAVAAVAVRPGGAILESSLPGSRFARWSVLAFDPIETFTVPAGFPGCPFERIAEVFARQPHLEVDDRPPPFRGGWIGFLSYEAGLMSEGVPAVATGEIPLPLARFSLYDTALVHNGRSGRLYAIAVDWPAGSGIDRPPAGDRLRASATILQNALRGAPAPLTASPSQGELVPSLTRDQYLERVGRILDHIAAGDVYQVNLTQRFRTFTDLSPFDLYRRVRAISPSSHAAFLRFEEAALISSSPELFLRTNGRRIISRPIKGTRPRSTDPILDRQFREQLRTSEKDSAELAMIVDLVRNDLGRVCDWGSIRVLHPASIEQHPTVYHRVATIEGRVRAGASPGDVMRAMFPGGSVTGAPKIRAMQLISELEAAPREAYCGSIGWIGLDGSISLNLGIRTMIQRGGVLDLYAGGGIVADSNPDDEYDEVMTKLTGVARAAGCPLPDRSRRRALIGAAAP